MNDLPIIDDWTIPKGLTHFSQPKVKLGNVFVNTKIQNFRFFKKNIYSISQSYNWRVGLYTHCVMLYISHQKNTNLIK